MGNCTFKGMSVLDEKIIKVVTSNGGIMELHTPITVESITNEFPGHGIYRSLNDLFSEPLHHNEELRTGELYHLLPLHPFSRISSSKSIAGQLPNNDVALTPYRMSTYNKNKNNMRWSEPEVFPRYNNRGMWKVKLVISPEQLSQILSQESRTEELIESVRTVAKCGNGVFNSNPETVSGSSYFQGSLEY